MTKGLFIMSLFLLLLMPAKGQLIRVESLLSSDSIMIGEQITYTLRVDADIDIEFTEVYMGNPTLFQLSPSYS